MPKGNSEIQDRAAECVVEMVDLQQNNMKLEEEYAVGLMTLKNTNLTIHKTIMSLDNPYKTVLIHIYELNKTRDETAEILERSKRWIDTLIGHSLIRYRKERNKNFQKI